MKTRIGALLIAAVFVLGFGLTGIFFGTVPLIKTLHEAWKMQSFESAEAQVVDAKLIYGSEGTRSVQARYRYLVNGQAYESTRVGLLDQGSDNIGSWHEDWHGLLEQSRLSGRPIKIWVNPRQPQEALIDRDIRWPKLFFLIPFATLFPAVGLITLWVFVKLLVSPLNPSKPLAENRGGSEAAILKDDSATQARGAWVFTIFWNLLSWPIALTAWLTNKGLGISFFISLFPLLGLVLLWLAIAASLRARRVRGTELTAQAQSPSIGETFKVTIALPAQRLDGRRTFELHLVESRIRDSDSSPTPREIRTEQKKPALQLLANGSGRLEAEFAIPSECTPTDKVIDGERTVWYLKLMDMANGDVQNFELTVLPGNRLHTDSSPATEPRASKISLGGLAGGWTAAGNSLSPIPDKVMRITESNGRWTAQFATNTSRFFGLLWLVPAVFAFIMARRSFLGDDSADVALAVIWMVAGCAGLGFCIHQISNSWRLVLDQHGMTVERDSWLWRRGTTLAREDMTNLQKYRAYQLRTGAGYLPYFQVHALTRNGKRVQLTPGIAFDSFADAAADAIHAAQKNYAQLFSPLHKEAAARSGKTGGWLLFGALALIACGAASLNSTYRWGDPVSIAHIALDWKARLGRLTPAGMQYNELAVAQDRSDLPALEALLKTGVDPNTVVNNGPTLLMLAARRGELAHVELLLRHGADVNRRDETSNDNRGDSALLVALHGGHEQVVRRLLQAGARLDVSNMWDWRPMHMAAQGNCIPCLNLLREKGLSIHARAHASRGETPAMLAAAKGHLEALQWFIANGADLREKDSYGKTALDWALFGKQEKTARWIRENSR
jgi:hypothetical protein